MIVSIKSAILHVLDVNSGRKFFSDSELDVSDAITSNFITRHIERIYDGSGLRNGEFTDNSGFKYHLSEYIKGETDFQQFSMFIAGRFYDAISASEDTESFDVIVCDCVANDRPTLVILKCDNKIGYTHQVLQDEGKISNVLINHYAILPTTKQKISECAFIDKDDFSIKYIGKKHKIDGEKVDLIADIVLECYFDISVRESINAVKKIAKKVTDDNGGDSIETSAKMKEYIVENVMEKIEDDIENEDEDEVFEKESRYIEPKEIAKAVFDGKPAMREEFMEKLEEIGVPEKVQVTKYVTKKIGANVKLSTDIGVELSFPAEYYRDSKYIDIINNEDGTISIKINNIGELINK